MVGDGHAPGGHGHTAAQRRQGSGGRNRRLPASVKDGTEAARTSAVDGTRVRSKRVEKDHPDEEGEEGSSTRRRRSGHPHWDELECQWLVPLDDC